MTLLPSTVPVVLTILGVGLDIISVRAVRFEPASTCSLLTSNPTPGTVNSTVLANVSGSNHTMITVTDLSTLGSASYSVCVDFAANPPVGSFLKVGSAQFLVREYLLHIFCVLLRVDLIFFLQRLLCHSPPQPYLLSSLLRRSPLLVLGWMLPVSEQFVLSRLPYARH